MKKGIWVCLVAMLFLLVAGAANGEDKWMSRLYFMKAGEYPLVEIALPNRQLGIADIIILAFIINDLNKFGYVDQKFTEWPFFKTPGDKPQLPLYQFQIGKDHKICIIVFLPGEGRILFEQHEVLHINEAIRRLSLP